MIFNLGFSPWWSSYYPDDYYYDYGFPNDGYGSSTYGYDYPYSYNYDAGDYNSGDYQSQMYYDQNSDPGQSQGYYDSGVYQTETYDDPNGYSDESQLSQHRSDSLDRGTIAARQMVYSVLRCRRPSGVIKTPTVCARLATSIATPAR